MWQTAVFILSILCRKKIKIVPFFFLSGRLSRIANRWKMESSRARDRLQVYIYSRAMIYMIYYIVYSPKTFHEIEDLGRDSWGDARRPLAKKKKDVQIPFFTPPPPLSDCFPRYVHVSIIYIYIYDITIIMVQQAAKCYRAYHVPERRIERARSNNVYTIF